MSSTRVFLVAGCAESPAFAACVFGWRGNSGLRALSMTVSRAGSGLKSLKYLAACCCCSKSKTSAWSGEMCQVSKSARSPKSCQVSKHCLASGCARSGTRGFWFMASTARYGNRGCCAPSLPLPLSLSPSPLSLSLSLSLSPLPLPLSAPVNESIQSG